MAELIEPGPRLVIVMGCDGCGKTVWKRANHGRLPDKYFDQDSIAGGIGDWNDPGARERTRMYVDAQIEACFAARESFGAESAFSGRPGPALIARAKAEGYRIEGYYIGTESPAVNARRIDERVLSHTGHYVDPKEIPGRYRWSLSNLRKALGDFDLVEVVDNTADAVDRIPEPKMQFVTERDQVTMQLPPDEMAPWCREFLRERELDRRRASLRDRAERANRACGRSGR